MITTIALLMGIATPGVVTQDEFDQAKVGMYKHEVHELWGARGEFAVTYYDEVGDEHRVRRYFTPEGSAFLVDWRQRTSRFRLDHMVQQ